MLCIFITLMMRSSKNQLGSFSERYKLLVKVLDLCDEAVQLKRKNKLQQCHLFNGL